MSSNSSDGLILVCTRHGIVEQVLYDGLELSDGQSAGLSFTSLVLSESLRTATEMLEALQRDGTAFDWALNVRAGGQKVLLHALGYTLDEKLIVIGAQSRTLLRELYHHMLKSHHREISGASELVDEERNSHLAREQALQLKVDQLVQQFRRVEVFHLTKIRSAFHARHDVGFPLRRERLSLEGDAPTPKRVHCRAAT